MKHDAMFLEQLQQEVPRKNLSSKATQRFEDTYQMLGVQQEAPVRRHRHKGLWITATAACLCCGMLFGVNATFPAFAEGLPVVGRFFETVNNGFSSIKDSKTAHGTFLNTYDVEDVNLTVENGDYSMKVMQAFSDGKNVGFTMDVTVPSEIWDRYEWLSVYKDIQLTVNDTPVETTFSTTLNRGETNHYVGAVSFALPNTAAEGEQLDISVFFPEITLPDKLTKEGYIYVDVDWNADFTVTVDTSGNKSFDATAEDNGMQILHVDSSPTQTIITTNVPDWFDELSIYPRLYTMYAQPLNYSTPLTPREEGAQTATLTFDGAPSVTEQLVVRFYDGYEETKVEAEFTIDLINQTVTPSTTYDDGGALDLNDPFHYKYLSCFISGEPSFENHFAVNSASYAKENNSWGIGLLTDEAYKEVLVEAYTASGELIGSTVSEYGTEYGQINWFWDENSPWWGGNNPDKVGGGYPYYAYSVYLDCEQAYMPAINETITLVVKDNTSGEELMRQDLTLDQIDN